MPDSADKKELSPRAVLFLTVFDSVYKAATKVG